MENEIIKRLESLIRCKSANPTAFAKEIGCKQSTISNQLNGKRHLSLDTIIATLTTYSDVSSDWLLLGVGEMQKQVVGTNYNISNIKVGSGTAVGVGNVVTNNAEVENLRRQAEADKKKIKELEQKLEEARNRLDKLVDKLINQ